MNNTQLEVRIQAINEEIHKLIDLKKNSEPEPTEIEYLFQDAMYHLSVGMGALMKVKDLNNG